MCVRGFGVRTHAAVTASHASGCVASARAHSCRAAAASRATPPLPSPNLRGGGGVGGGGRGEVRNILELRELRELREEAAALTQMSGEK